jgi:hypothetical protein
MKNTSLFPFLLLAIAALGCSSLRELETKANSDNSSNNSTSNGKTDGSITASSDPKADLVAMSKKFTEQRSFRANMNGTGKTSMKMELEYIAPDRFHMKNGEVMETIVIGKDTYTKSGGTWRKIPIDLGKTIPNLRDTFTEHGLKLLSDVKNEPDETVGGESALVYSYKGKSPADASVYNSKIWISKSTGLPLKIEATYPSGNLDKMVINYEYPADIVIEAPVKN